MIIWCEIEGMLSERVQGERRTTRVPVPKRIQFMRALIARGHYVVLWSRRGNDVARDFAEKHKLQPALCLGGPDVCFGSSVEEPGGTVKTIGPRGMEHFIRKEGLLK